MVPCQPRQLVILSLPFAVLVAFFWYKRRKSSSHSDPGGTLARTEPVDKTVPISVPQPKLGGLKEELYEQVVNDCYRKNLEEVYSIPKVEAVILKEIQGNFLDSTPLKSDKTDPIISAVSGKSTESIPSVKENEVICNGVAFHIKSKPEADRCVCTVDNHPATTNFEIGAIFHSTIIDDQDFEESSQNSSTEDNQPLEEPAQGIGLENLETVDKLNCTSTKTGEVGEKSDRENESEVNFHKIPLEEQSTLENIASKNKAVSTVIPGESSLVDKILETTFSLDDIVESDINIKDVSSVISDKVERIENTSTDTGLSSQESSASEDSTISMAQGQKTEENTQNNASGLEQKLASLGLDTQQPGQQQQRVERDSANHSPAEVMLSSPAISTFSDAHSEGSSDSGKGCSDVVTPPSRTPAGGSSVAGDQAPSVYEFVLPQVIVGRLIGRHGAFLHDIRAKTHTNIFIKRHPETNSLKICAIEGTQQDINAALKMIRQKFPLRRFPELTLERVTFVKNSCLPINPDNLQLHLVEGVNNDVIFSSLITAGHFFLQLPMHMSYQSLYRLACIMNTVYSTQESPPLPDPQPDVVCVAPAHGGWYRAQILSVDDEAHTSDIRFLDYGGYLTVDNSLLRQIRGDFLLLPFQAVECALANVIPAGGEEEWSEEAKQFVQLMTTQQTLQAQVYDYTDSGLPLVYLYCTQFYQSPTDPSGYETRVVLLNQELVSRGFAELIDASQEVSCEQTTSAETS